MGDDDPALHVIVLGSGGGPLENNTTALLVRSVAQQWSKGSILAVDGGVHLSALTRIIAAALPSPLPRELPRTLADGPFAGLPLHHRSAAAVATHVAGTLIDTVLVTHPHLDHISGFVVNTANIPGSRPKKLAALPSTIQALKNHIFNNIIWPNLSDENNGAGLLTYLRLVEGGSPALGDGQGRGYLEVCDGLLVKTWSVSHGHCIERHSHRGSASSASPRFGSHDASVQLPRPGFGHAATSQTVPGPRGPPQSLLSHATLGTASPQFGAVGEQEKYCVYDSSAFFIQDQDHRREVLIFGDVEPDSLSLHPRNLLIWQEAAPKVANGTLGAIFIECSYDDSQDIDRLFGHLKPVFVMEELRVLAGEVAAVRSRPGAVESRKRKRSTAADEGGPRQMAGPARQNAASGAALEDPLSPRSIRPSPSQPADPSLADGPSATDDVDEVDRKAAAPRPLQGLKVVIIHVKEKLADGPEAGETILQQLREHEAEARLGCEFIVSRPGQSFYL